jgi:hypothetical protein
MWVRAFFGIAMGGVWGNAAATALEDAPVEARGILSGILQQGYDHYSRQSHPPATTARDFSRSASTC